MESGAEMLRALAEPIAAELGLEIFDVELAGKPPRQIVRIYLDSPDGRRGVTVGDCETVSRRVSDAIDAHEAVVGTYLLEVSSPGVNRRLRTPVHFRRAIGERVHVRLREPLGAASHIKGRLVAADDLGIVVETANGEVVECPLGAIASANVEFEFPGPSGGRRGKGRRRGKTV